MNEVVELLLDVARDVRTLNDGKNDWLKVNLIMAKHGIVKTPNAWKKMFQRHAKKEDKLPIQELTIDKQTYLDDYSSLKFNADGTQFSERIIKMSDKEMKNPDDVLIAHGYDPKQWKIISMTSNLWKTQTSEGDLHNYQSKITVKEITQSNELSKEDILDIVANFKPIERNLKLKVINTSDKEKLALEIVFSDIHIGSFSWNEEVGKDYDIKIAIEKIQKVIKEAKEIIELYPIEKIYLCFLGDFVHIDTVDSTTSKGTRLDADSRPKKIVKKSLEVVMSIIEELSLVETEVYWIEGNHSRLVEYSVFMSLPYIYKNVEHIKFNVEPISRKAFMYKGNLIGLHHGEMKKDQLFTWIQTEYRELWGKSTYVEQHSGHLHQELETVEKGGIIQRTNPTIKEQDLYEYENGWKSYKAVVAYLWSESENLKAKFYLR